MHYNKILINKLFLNYCIYKGCKCLRWFYFFGVNFLSRECIKFLYKDITLGFSKAMKCS